MDYYNYGNAGIPGINPTTFVQQPTNQQVTNCPLDNRFMWIASKEMARTNPMAPDKTILYLDENDSYAYLRRTDKEGKTKEFRVFRLEEEIQPEPEPTIPANMVTRNEFETFTKNIDVSMNELKEMILSINKPNYNNQQYNKDKRQVRTDGKT